MRQVLTVLRPVLRQLGAQPTVRWHGSAACELQLGELPRQSGLQGGAFLVRLLPRDIPLAWAFRHWRGRRDRLDLIWQPLDASQLAGLPRPALPVVIDWQPDPVEGALRAAFDLRPGYEAAVSDCLLSMAASFRQPGEERAEVAGIVGGDAPQRGAGG